MASPSSLSKVLLYYCYEPISDLDDCMKRQENVCKEHNILGRIRVAKEGLNGTIVGSEDDLEVYKKETESFLKRNDIDWKCSPIGEDGVLPFDDLMIKSVNHLVGWDNGSNYTLSRTATHLSPEEFHKKLEDKKDNIAIIDVRNTYEYDIGHFEDAIDPKTRQFSDFEKWFKKEGVEKVKDKDELLLYCTGGIRCEKASAAVRDILENSSTTLETQKNIPKVYQLQGGIHRYLEKFGAKGKYLGKNFVFDKRVVQPLPKEQTPLVKNVGKCLYCEKPWEKILKDRRCTKCRMLILVCDECNDNENSQGNWCKIHSYLDPRKTSVDVLQRRKRELENEATTCLENKLRQKRIRKQLKEIETVIDKIVTSNAPTAEPLLAQ